MSRPAEVSKDGKTFVLNKYGSYYYNKENPQEILSLADAQSAPQEQPSQDEEPSPEGDSSSSF